MSKNITVSDSTTFYRPILELYRDEEEHKSSDIKKEVLAMLSEEERNDERVENCITWPIQHFYYANCLKRIRTGYYRITARGINLLDSDNESLDEKTLKELYPEYIDRRNNLQVSEEEDLIDLDIGVMDKDTSFEDALKIVQSLLKNNGTSFEGSYDMLVVKKLSPSDLIQENKPEDNNANTVQIALTTEKMDIFPFLESFSYFYTEGGERYTNFKTKFLLEVPVRLFSSNFEYLNIFNQDIDSEILRNEEIETTTTVLRRRSNKPWDLDAFKNKIDTYESNDYKFRMKLLGYEVQTELSSGLSGYEFQQFRKLLYEDFYLIILKHEDEFEYDIFSILPDDGKNILPKFEMYISSKKSITVLSPKIWSPYLDYNEIGFNGENVLLYGVPGSGKSFAIQEYCNDESRMERVVFHPDYTYSDFVGQILPKTDENGKISYPFVRGPFTSILKKAFCNPNKNFYLIIEEINRGNAPAIFGDVFQLLDRVTEDEYKKDKKLPIGASEYGISNSDIAKEVYGNKNEKVRIPPNLSIIATMNTSDQNVFTLDTAFQRRWKMRLIPNKFTSDHEFALDNILDTDVTWKQFVNYVNNLILEKNTLVSSSEDKRLGVYFVQKEDLNEFKKNGDKNNSFAEKVLKYLWDDAFKFSNNVFSEDCKSLEDVIYTFTTSTGNDRFSIFKNKDDLIKFNDS